MYAIVVSTPGGPEVMNWAEVPDISPGPDEVLVKTVGAGVNRADLLQRRGYYPPPEGVSDTIGLEASGVVTKVGKNVSTWRPGDQVVGLLAGGAYAQYFVCPSGQLVPPPANVDLVNSAALIEVAATVISNLDHISLTGDDIFLVHGGSGGIGAFAIQYAKTLGCTVATTAGTAEKLAYCKQLGADIVLNYHDDWVSELHEATGGHGVDAILDIIGAKYLSANTKSLAIGGRMTVIGLQGGTRGELNLNRLLMKRATITATSLRYRPIAEKSAICERVRNVIWPLYESGEILLPKITRFPITQAGQAHQQLDSGDNVGKIVLTLD